MTFGSRRRRSSRARSRGVPGLRRPRARCEALLRRAYVGLGVGARVRPDEVVCGAATGASSRYLEQARRPTAARSIEDLVGQNAGSVDQVDPGFALTESAPRSFRRASFSSAKARFGSPAGVHIASRDARPRSGFRATPTVAFSRVSAHLFAASSALPFPGTVPRAPPSRAPPPILTERTSHGVLVQTPRRGEGDFPHARPRERQPDHAPPREAPADVRGPGPTR